MSDFQVDIVTKPSVAAQRKLDRLRKAAGQVVGSLFYGTLLKTMRESKLKGPYGHGGRGEEVFSAQLHGILAERMGSATKRGVNDALYNALEKQTQLIADAAAKRLER